MAIDKFKSLSAGLPVSTRSSPKRELAPITTTLAFCLTNNLDSSTSIGMSVNGHFSTPTLDFVPNSANFSYLSSSFIIKALTPIDGGTELP